MQIESLIKLLSETLKFYANESNYSNDLIKKDGGHQARFVLNLIKENEAMMKTYENQFDEFQNNEIEGKSADDITKMIEDLKNFK